MNEYLPPVWRHARKNNTRWLLYAIEKGYINPIPETGKILNRWNIECKEHLNPFGYHYIKLYMHRTWFSFYVHKAIYAKTHGFIPKGKEIDHADSDLSNNKASNIIALTTKQNLKKRRYKPKTEGAF